MKCQLDGFHDWCSSFGAMRVVWAVTFLNTAHSPTVYNRMQFVTLPTGLEAFMASDCKALHRIRLDPIDPSKPLRVIHHLANQEREPDCARFWVDTTTPESS